MDENAKRDQNRVPVTLCVNADERDKTLMLRVDPATGAVLIDSLGSATAAPQITPMPRDANRVTTLSFADETNSTDSWAARVEETNNRLIVKYV
jgi:hypothetical protein